MREGGSSSSSSSMREGGSGSSSCKREGGSSSSSRREGGRENPPVQLIFSISGFRVEDILQHRADIPHAQPGSQAPTSKRALTTSIRVDRSRYSHARSYKACRGSEGSGMAVACSYKACRGGRAVGAHTRPAGAVRAVAVAHSYKACNRGRGRGRGATDEGVGEEEGWCLLVGWSVSSPFGKKSMQ